MRFDFRFFEILYGVRDLHFITISIIDMNTVRFRTNSRLGRLTLKLIGSGLILLYLAFSAQIIAPVSQLFQIAHINEDFPCAHHQCACKNALQCKLKCCCFKKGFGAPENGHENQIARNVGDCWLAVDRCDSHQQDAFTSAPKFEPHVPLEDFFTNGVHSKLLKHFDFNPRYIGLTPPPPEKVPILA